MVTKKQKWARRRNWLIMRLMGARSIFSWSNILFMQESIKDDVDTRVVYNCDTAISNLLDALRKTKQG